MQKLKILKEMMQDSELAFDNFVETRHCMVNKYSISKAISRDMWLSDLGHSTSI